MIKSFNPEQLKKYKQHLLQVKGRRPSTINRRLSGLSAFARFLMQKGLLAYNPLDLVGRLRQDGSTIERMWASWNIVQEWRSKVKQELLHFPGRFIAELLYAGMTIQEIHSPFWYHSENGSAFLTIGERKVMLHQEAKLGMQQYLELKKIVTANNLAEANWNGMLKPRQIYALVRRFSKKIGHRVTIRDLRLAQFNPALRDADISIAA